MRSGPRILVLRPLRERELLITTLLRLGAELVILDEPSSDLFGMADRQIPVTSVVDAARRGDTSAIEDAVAAFHKQRPLDGIITMLDYLLPVMGRLNDRLGLPGLSEDAARNCHDKGRQRALFARHGVPTAAFAAAESLERARSAAATIGFPVVVKPADMTGSRGVRRVDGDEQLAAAYAGARQESWGGGVLVEEYLAGAELSAESVTTAAGTRQILTIDKRVAAAPYFVEDGAVVPGSHPDAIREAVADVVDRALRALGVRCAVTHTEVRLTADGPKVIEINGRVAGMCLADMVLEATGVNLYAAQVAAMLGGPAPDPPPPRPRGYLAQRSILAGVGVVAEVDVDGLAGAGRELAGLRLAVGPGSRLEEVSHSNAVRGIVIARGDTPTRAYDAATRLRDAVRLRCTTDLTAAR